MRMIAVEWHDISPFNRAGLPGWCPCYTFRAGDEHIAMTGHSPSVRRVSIWVLPLP